MVHQHAVADHAPPAPAPYISMAGGSTTVAGIIPEGSLEKTARKKGVAIHGITNSDCGARRTFTGPISLHGTSNALTRWRLL
eukprot:2075535-Amphidinium_carterae.1